jgi:hypothetical protein
LKKLTKILIKLLKNIELEEKIEKNDFTKIIFKQYDEIFEENEICIKKNNIIKDEYRLALNIRSNNISRRSTINLFKTIEFIFHLKFIDSISKESIRRFEYENNIVYL